MSTSAFIPFCDFGGNITSLGSMIDGFKTPVCDSFKPKQFNDQLCYEVDLNLYNKNHLQKDLKYGFGFIMDYNEDREISRDIQSKSVIERGIVSRMSTSDDHHLASIYLNTIGLYCIDNDSYINNPPSTITTSLFRAC